jgi:predicted transposase YdaD
MVDHDRLFKQLLSTFFLEFLQLFAPDLASDVEAGSVEFLEKENFTDALAGTHHVVDLLARVRLRGGAGYVLVHVENQADANDIGQFPRRMFRYFAGIEMRHGLPIYPVAVLSYERPQALCPDVFEMNLPGLEVLKFRFRTVQLNALSWREYLEHHNPVAAALMSRMRMHPAERARVKLECFALLARLRLDAGKMQLACSFVETYLNLGGDERRLMTEALREMPADRREEVMQLTTPWHRWGREEGREEGRHEAATEMVLRLIRRRAGDVPDTLAARVDALPLETLQLLGEDVLDLATVADVEAWLSRHE